MAGVETGDTEAWAMAMDRVELDDSAPLSEWRVTDGPFVPRVSSSSSLLVSPSPSHLSSSSSSHQLQHPHVGRDVHDFDFADSGANNTEDASSSPYSSYVSKHLTDSVSHLQRRFNQRFLQYKEISHDKLLGKYLNPLADNATVTLKQTKGASETAPRRNQSTSSFEFELSEKPSSFKDKEGYLQCSSNGKSGYVKRWILLEESSLLCYHQADIPSPASATSPAAPSSSPSPQVFPPLPTHHHKDLTTNLQE